MISKNSISIPKNEKPKLEILNNFVEYLCIFSSTTKIEQRIFQNSDENKYSSVHSLNLSYIYKLFSNKYKYFPKGEIILSSDYIIKHSEEQLKNTIKIFINSKTADCCILILSGYSSDNGSFILSTDKGLCELKYEEIETLWNQRINKQKNKRLLIIIDCYKSSWVKENDEKLNYKSDIGIYIQSCCNEYKPIDINDLGGLFFLHFYFSNINDRKNFLDEKIYPQDPISSGFKVEVFRYFGFKAIFNNYSDYSLDYSENIKILNYGIYEGDVDKGIPNGKGILKFNNKDIYEGEFIKGKKKGRGIIKYVSGSVYEGLWEDDCKHGKGIYKYNNGNQYIGEFNKDLYHGIGKLIFSDGEYYEGEFKEGLYNGKGKYKYFNQSTYEGHFVNGVRCGNGIFYYNNGAIYEGEFEYGLRNGKGTYQFVNGSKYVGFFCNDKRNGNGKMIYSNTTIYEGEWFNDKRHGTGKIQYSNGTKYEGLFKHDERCDMIEKNYYDVCNFKEIFLLNI